MNSIISKEIIDTVAQEISRGVPIKYACMIGGISTEAYYSWIRKGEKEKDNPDSLYAYHKRKSEHAKALAVATRVEKIRVDNSWQSAAWWLERMAHDDFGKKQTIDTNVNANVKHTNLNELFDDDKIKEILEEDEATDDEEIE